MAPQKEKNQMLKIMLLNAERKVAFVYIFQGQVFAIGKHKW